MRKWTISSCRAVLGAVAVLIAFAGSLQAETQRVATRNPGVEPSVYGSVVVPIPGFSDYIEILLEYETGTTVYTYVQPSTRFTFYDLVPGTYYIVIEVPGFEPVRDRLDIVNGRPPMAKAIFLTPESGSSGGNRGGVTSVKIRKKYPKKAVEEFEKAEDSLGQGDLQKALDRLNAAVKAAPEFVEAYDLQGTVYYRMRRLPEAEGAFRKAMAVDSQAPLPRINLGMLLLDAADGAVDKDKAAATRVYTAAYNLLSEAVKLDTGSPLATFLLGVSCYRSGRYDEAETNFKRAVELNGRMGQARIMLANVYIRKENWEGALTQLESYLKSNPKAPDAAQIAETRTKIADRVKAGRK